MLIEHIFKGSLIKHPDFILKSIDILLDLELGINNSNFQLSWKNIFINYLEYINEDGIELQIQTFDNEAIKLSYVKVSKEIFSTCIDVV